MALIQLSSHHDNKVNAQNHLIEMTYKSYIELSQSILENNEFQRNRVNKATSVYSLLKNDIKEGCIIPSLVLAKTDGNTNIETDTDLDPEHLIILDGLQRTYTLIDAYNELQRKPEDRDVLQTFCDRKIRIEIYTGINRLGILYRMLTLNTGQTPMSMRHQIEILYSDLIECGIDNIRLFREVESKESNSLGNYRFKEIIEGFHSYLEKTEFPIDRFDLLKNIKALGSIKNENLTDHDTFQEFVKTYDMFVHKINEIFNKWEYQKENDEYELSNIFGENIEKVFTKSQVITAFGAATSKLIEAGLYSEFSKIGDTINQLSMAGSDANHVMMTLLHRLESIRNDASKIGNAQRTFFKNFIISLFNSEDDTFMNFEASIENAYEQSRKKIQLFD